MLETKHIKSIETVLTTAKKDLVSSMVKDIDNSTSDNINETMKDISTINRVLEMFGLHTVSAKTTKRGRPAANAKASTKSEPDTKTAKTEKVAKTEKDSVRKTTKSSDKNTKAKTSTKKAEAKSDSDEAPKRGRKKKAPVYHLGDDMKGKRPIAINMNGNRHEIASFRDMARAICEESFASNPIAFANLENIEDVNGSDHPYFSVIGSAGMNEPIELKSKDGETCFVDVAKLAMNNMLFLRKMLKYLGIEEKNINIEIDPNYERKPRTTKGTEG